MEVELPEITREEVVPCRIKLIITVPGQWVDNVFKEIESMFLNKARLPGFRPGKAPGSLIWRKYGDEIVESVKERLLRDVANEAIKREGLAQESPLIVENEEELQPRRGEEFVFNVVFDVAPDFELPDYRAIPLADDSIEVGEERIEGTIDEIMKNRISYEKVERPAQENDLLKSSYKALPGESAMEELPQSAKFIVRNENGWLALRKPEILPGISQSLLGVEAGEQREISVEFPDDYFEKALAGEKLRYKVEIHEVQAPVVPELTDEIARELGAENAEDVKKRVRENLEQREQQDKEQRQRSEIISALLDSVDFELPPTVLAQETYEVFQQQYQRMAEKKDEEEVRGKQEEIYKEAEENARRHLKRNYILLRIAQEEQIMLEDNEIQSVIEALSRYHRTTFKKMMRQLQESGRIIELLDEVRASKTLDYLRSLLTGDNQWESEDGTEQDDVSDPSV